MNAQRQLALASTATVLLAAAGCTSVRQTFVDVDARQVWAAMKVVAESPDYPDWKVTDNQVLVDEPNHRIEVSRKLARELRRPGARPRSEARTVRYEITLEELDPPTAKFISRGFGVPAHAIDDANQYFTEVYVIITGLPGGATDKRGDGAQDES